MNIILMLPSTYDDDNENNLLLEDGFDLLLEDGTNNKILLES